jgi:hypothetical protein
LWSLDDSSFQRDPILLLATHFKQDTIHTI